MERVSVVIVHVVNALGRLESHVVVAWVVVLPECSSLSCEQWASVTT